LVCVYGTLRRGGSNHFRMAEARFVENCTLRGRLYRIDWYPGLVLDSGGDEIQGELYMTTPELLAELDAFEGHEYRRIRAAVKTPYGIPMQAWIWEWLMPVDGGQRITGGDWLNEHGI
jgi:gamma-glutamylcyclotransferase (GGCT)/AIG2-like uncharacterized protein YtfP